MGKLKELLAELESHSLPKKQRLKAAIQKAKIDYETDRDAVLERRRIGEEKAKKRRVNVEIASELVDLLMDVAESAFEYLDQNKEQPDIDDRLLNKKVWREWMGVFTEGKKVSEANIVITQEEEVEQTDVDSNPLAQLLGYGVENVTPSQIIDKVKGEMVYSEFLQYLTVSGVMNLQKYANP